MLECPRTNAKTFVDDAYLLTRTKDDQSMEDAIVETMNKVEDYMRSNRLSLNKDKTQFMLITKDDLLKKNLAIEMSGKVVKHQRELKILGNTLSENLTWDSHVQKILIPALNNRVRTLRMISKYMGIKFKKIYANSVFKSKVMFGIETWGGASRKMISKIQNLQDQTMKLSLPKELKNKNSRQRLKLMNWMSIEQEVESATHKQTYKILNWKIPEEIAEKMPMNSNSMRMQTNQKLATKPKWLTRNKISRASYRNRAYLFNTLPNVVTAQKSFKDFKKELKKYYNTR